MNSMNKQSKNSEDYIAPKLNPKTDIKDSNLKQSSFGINNPFQAPNKQFETTYEIGYNNKGLANKTFYNCGKRPNITLSNNNNGLYGTENKTGYPYKVNEISEKEIKDKKGVVENIKKHHWDNGSNKGLFSTTHAEFYKFDNNKAKFANIPLKEEKKDDLRKSHYELGKGKIPFIATQLNAYLPTNNSKPATSEDKLKNSSINFNPRAGNIKGKTIYMTDYTQKDNIE